MEKEYAFNPSSQIKVLGNLEVMRVEEGTVYGRADICLQRVDQNGHSIQFKGPTPKFVPFEFQVPFKFASPGCGNIFFVGNFKGEFSLNENQPSACKVFSCNLFARQQDLLKAMNEENEESASSSMAVESAVVKPPASQESHPLYKSTIESMSYKDVAEGVAITKYLKSQQEAEGAKPAFDYLQHQFASKAALEGEVGRLWDQLRKASLINEKALMLAQMVKDVDGDSTLRVALGRHMSSLASCIDLEHDMVQEISQACNKHYAK